MSLSQHLDLDNTLGAAFIGNIVASVLYGVTCLQTYVYYKRSQGDHPAFRALIYGLWFLDTLHLALVTHALYFYLIKSYNNPITLLFPNWSIISQVFVTCVCDVIVRAIYGRRVWKISKSYIVGILVTLTAAAAFGGGIAFGYRAFIEETFANFSHISYLMYMALGAAVAADILIASSLCISLSRSRTGFKKTDSMVTVLMMYAINSSVLTTVCSAACFITYTVWPRQFTFIGIYVCLSKLFLNSLLAMLNGRSALKKRVAGLSDTPFQFSHSSMKPPEFSHSFMSNKEFYPMESAPSPMIISVNTEVETRGEV